MSLIVHRFNLNNILARNKNNPYVSYTINFKNKKIIVSDLNIWHRFYHIAAKKN